MKKNESNSHHLLALTVRQAPALWAMLKDFTSFNSQTLQWESFYLAVFMENKTEAQRVCGLSIVPSL